MLLHHCYHALPVLLVLILIKPVLLQIQQVACFAGFYGNTGSQSNRNCTGPCPAGYECGIGTVTPLPCAQGSYALLGTSQSLTCLTGTYQNKHVHILCLDCGMVNTEINGA